jgi:hypothetical protein
MSTATVIAGDFEDAGQMIEAIRAFRARLAAEEAAEEQAANEAMQSDPATRAWVEAAVLENAALN